MTNRYSQYYQQSGSGLKDIGLLYRAPPYNQKGEGLGDFFTTAYRFLNPLFRSGLSVLGNQVIQSGSNILSDLGRKDLSTIVQEQSENAIKNLSEKAINKIKRSTGNQTGSGRSSGIMSKTRGRRRRSARQKGIKTNQFQSGHHISLRRRIGTSATKTNKNSQIGGRRKRKRKTRHTSKTSNKRRRHLDIFN